MDGVWGSANPVHLLTSRHLGNHRVEWAKVKLLVKERDQNFCTQPPWLQMTVTGVMSCSSIQDIAEKAPFTRPNRGCNKESAHCVHFTSLCGDPTDLTLLSKYSYYLNFRWWSRSALSVSHIWHHRSYLSSPCRGGSDSPTLITRGLIARVNAPLNGRCLWVAEDSVVIRALGLDYSVWSNRCLWVRNIFQFISSLLQFTFNFV